MNTDSPAALEGRKHTAIDPVGNFFEDSRPFSYSFYRAMLKRDGKPFAIVSPDGKEALSERDANLLLTALNHKAHGPVSSNASETDEFLRAKDFAFVPCDLAVFCRTIEGQRNAARFDLSNALAHHALLLAQNAEMREALEKIEVEADSGRLTLITELAHAALSRNGGKV